MTPLYTLNQPVQITATQHIGVIRHIRRAGPFWPTTYTVAVPGQEPDRIYHEPELAPVKGVAHGIAPHPVRTDPVHHPLRRRRRDHALA